MKATALILFLMEGFVWIASFVYIPYETFVQALVIVCLHFNIMINYSQVCVFVVVIHLTDFVYGQEKYYDQKYDNFDVDYFAQNPRLLRRYMECFLDKGPCTPVGRVFKMVLPELITTSCTKCSPSQKNLARKTFDAFKKFLPKELEELKKKLDPTNKFYDAFEKAISDS